MQDEVNEKVVALVINLGKEGGSLSEEAFRKALSKFQEELKKQKEQSRAKAQEKKETGKQSMKSMMKKNTQLTNIEVTEKNIKSFEKIARKYNIDFALKKDKAAEKPKYLVFFKARDVDVMTAAFKEYSKKTELLKNKPSVRQKLFLYQQKIQKQQREMVKQRTRQRGQER